MSVIGRASGSAGTSVPEAFPGTLALGSVETALARRAFCPGASRFKVGAVRPLAPRRVGASRSRALEALAGPLAFRAIETTFFARRAVARLGSGRPAAGARAAWFELGSRRTLTAIVLALPSRVERACPRRPFARGAPGTPPSSF